MRKGLIETGTIRHSSDRGSQYAANALSRPVTAKRFSAKYERARADAAARDNAQAHAFLLAFQGGVDRRRRVLKYRAHARLETFSYIEGYYNLDQITFRFGVQKSVGI